MKKIFSFQLKSCLLLFLLSLFSASAWAETIPTDMFCLQAVGQASSVKMTASATTAPSVDLMYWKVGTSSSTAWESFLVGTTQVDLAAGEKVYIRAATQNTRLSASGAYNMFVMTGNIKASGNIMYLLDQNATTSTTFNTGAYGQYIFASLFKECTNLTDVSGLQLPATSLVSHCYSNMFWKTGITSAPQLPATVLADHCYYSMFASCSALQSAPQLPATSLENNCYDSMFSSCSALQSAPALPATALANYCYKNMFNDCGSLTSAPALPATTLKEGCYQEMFYKCTSLTSAPFLPAATLVGNCYYFMFRYCSNLKKVTAAFTAWEPTGVTNATKGWLNGVAANGTFTALSSSLPLTKNEANAMDVNRIPNGWNAGAAQFYWTLTPGATTYDGTSLKINVTAAVKVGETAWANSLTTDDDKKTVTFYTTNIDQIGTAGAGTLSAGTNAGEYVITVTDATTINALKAKLGQQILVKFQAGALRASQTAETAPYFDMDEGKAVAYTIPAAVNFALSLPSANIDHMQAVEGFDVYITAGTTQPTLASDAKIYLQHNQTATHLVVNLTNPALVPGTNNKWKYTAKVKKNNDGVVQAYDSGNEVNFKISNVDVTALPAGDYVLGIPADAFSTNLSKNAFMSQDMNVKAKAEISLTSYGVIKDAAVAPATDPTYTFIINAKAVAGSTNVQVTTDAATLAQGWTVTDYTGTIAVEALTTADPIYGNYKVTLDYTKLDATKTSWILSIPAGKFKANNNENALTKINFTIKDRAKWTGADTLSTSTTGYRISVDEIDGVATIVPTNPAQVLSILDASKIKLGYYTGSGASQTWNDVTATYSQAQSNEELKIMADFSTAHTPYYVIFQTGAVKAGNTVFQTKDTATDSIVARIDVVAGYTFVDASVATETVAATTKDDIVVNKTYNKLTYKRKYTGKLETLFVPFDIKPTEDNEILDNVKIWKLVNITEENGGPMFNFTQVENGQTVHANMPYLICKKDGVEGEYAMTQTSVTTTEPVSNSIESSTVTDTYTFTGVVEPTLVAGKWVVTKDRGALAKVPDGNTNKLNAWRWYMTTTSKNIEYARFNLDGDEDATEILNVEAENKDAVIYNLNGQRLSNVNRGAINIINGKKVIINK